MSNNPPLILITNDDGIDSPGLRAAAQAVLDLGEPLIVAPCRQWSGAGRSFSSASGRIQPRTLEIADQAIQAHCIEGTPAQAVLHTVLRLANRKPSLLIVGINYGENLGSDVTISGTVGAALQGADMGIPAMAVSLQTPKETHANPSDAVDFGAAIHFTQFFARRLLEISLPFDVDVLKIDLPDSATPQTPWRYTRISRSHYYHAIPPQGKDLLQQNHIDYQAQWDPQTLEPDSDIYALAIDRVVAVAPVSLDLTSRADPAQVEALLRGPTEL